MTFIEGTIGSFELLLQTALKDDGLKLFDSKLLKKQLEKTIRPVKKFHAATKAVKIADCIPPVVIAFSFIPTLGVDGAVNNKKSEISYMLYFQVYKVISFSPIILTLIILL